MHEVHIFIPGLFFGNTVFVVYVRCSNPSVGLGLCLCAGCLFIAKIQFNPGLFD